MTREHLNWGGEPATIGVVPSGQWVRDRALGRSCASISVGLLELGTVQDHLGWSLLDVGTVRDHLSWSLLEVGTVRDHLCWCMVEVGTVRDHLGWSLPEVGTVRDHELGRSDS